MKIKENQGNSNYRAYLASGVWAETKQKFLPEGSKCRVCSSDKWVTLHHKTYENLGREIEDDFIILCYKCHKKIHFSKNGYLRPSIYVMGEYHKLYAKYRRKMMPKSESKKKAFNCAVRYNKKYWC